MTSYKPFDAIMAERVQELARVRANLLVTQQDSAEGWTCRSSLRTRGEPTPGGVVTQSGRHLSSQRFSRLRALRPALLPDARAPLSGRPRRVRPATQTSARKQAPTTTGPTHTQRS